MALKTNLLKIYKFPKPVLKYDDSRYIPNREEELLWSREIIVPHKLIPRVAYRIREDYYKVVEIYTREDVTVPNMRLVGTDVFIHHIDESGEFAYVVECRTKAQHKVYFKFFRILQPGEFFNPNTWAIYSSFSDYMFKKTIPRNASRGAIRFNLELKNDAWYDTVKIAKEAERGYKPRYLSIRNYNRDLHEAVLNGLCWLMEDTGYWNTAEQELYNLTVEGDLFRHPIVQRALDASE